jgi:hypothetical protein
MRKYLGIHTFIDGSLGIEKIIASNKTKAYEIMERNGSNLLVLSKAELKKISKLASRDLRGKIWEI